MDFIELVERVHKARTKVPYVMNSNTLLCFDPGHTTGYAVFHGLELVQADEIVTKPIEDAARNVNVLLHDHTPDIVVMESYRVYKWRAKHHAGSELLTARVIGCIETLCAIHGVPHIIKQPAHIAKGFCTNARLKEWGFYKVGQKHACDAIRHGCHFLLFGAINQKEAQGLTVG